ncbi:MAG: hypothetical protein AAFP18_07855 [Bacteroidota bacterium]
MGQQQLLLLVLGIVIVGLGVVVGIESFQENARKSSIDRLTGQAVGYAGKMIEWKLKPSAQGGGQEAVNMTGLTVDYFGLEDDQSVSYLGGSADAGWAAVGGFNMKLYHMNGSGMAPHVVMHDPQKDILVSIFVFGTKPECFVHRISTLDSQGQRVDTPVFNPSNPDATNCSL